MSIEMRITSGWWQLLTQHSVDAEFLWRARQLASVATNYELSSLARLDNRLEAHIDGLRVAGEEGWQLARKEMEWKEAGEVFTAAILAFESNDPAKIADVLAIDALTPELSRGVISALGWMEYEQAAPHIRALCASQPRSHRRIGIAAAAIHRRDPGEPLVNALSSGDPLLRARAARAAGELGRRDLVPLLDENLKSDHAARRFWSAWSMALLVGYSKAIRILQSFAESPGPFRLQAFQLVLRRLPLTEAMHWNEQLRTHPDGLRLSLVGAGILGAPSVVPSLIEQMSIPAMARVAGEAFTTITGVDLAYQDLDTNAPEDFDTGPTEDPNDDNVDMDPDEGLPWPDATLIREWWNKNQHDFVPHLRYFMGKPVDKSWLEHVLRSGRQRQRAAAALDLAILDSGKPLFEVRAPGFRQVQLLRRADRVA
jgi:uncharacterized protein (TIGR02270 family)